MACLSRKRTGMPSSCAPCDALCCKQKDACLLWELNPMVPSLFSTDNILSFKWCSRRFWNCAPGYVWVVKWPSPPGVAPLAWRSARGGWCLSFMSSVDAWLLLLQVCLQTDAKVSGLSEAVAVPLVSGFALAHGHPDILNLPCTGKVLLSCCPKPAFSNTSFVPGAAQGTEILGTPALGRWNRCSL